MEEVYNKETVIRLGWHFSPIGRQLSKDSMTSRRKEVGSHHHGYQIRGRAQTWM